MSRFIYNQKKHALLWILFLAGAARLALIFTHGDRSLDNEWDPIVNNLLAGRGFAYYSVSFNGDVSTLYQTDPAVVLPSAYMPPLYAWFLTAISYFLGTGYWGIKIIELIQVVLGILTICFVYLTAKIKFNVEAGLVAASILAIYPVVAYMPGQISAVNLYVFLNCLLLYLLVKWECANEAVLLFISAVVSGLMLLSRPDFILYMIFISIWVYRRQRHRMRAYIIFILIIFCCVAPWIIRNWVTFNRFVPLTSSGGINLWEGIHEDATGTRSNYVYPSIEISPTMKRALQELKPIKNYELERDRIYKERALMDLAQHPFRAVKLALIKFTFLWGHYWGINCTYPGANSAAYWLPWFLQLPMFLYGLVVAIKKREPLSLFYMYLIIATLVAMIFFVIPRYRIFILPVVTLFASSGIVSLFKVRISSRMSGAP